MFVSEVEFMLHKKQLNRIIKIQELKLKLLEKEIKINKIDTRIQLTAMAAILKPSEMSDTDFVLKINEKMSELWSEEALRCKRILPEVFNKSIWRINLQ